MITATDRAWRRSRNEKLNRRTKLKNYKNMSNEEQNGFFAKPMLPAVTSRECRVEIVNEIIKEIASRSRKFFAGKFGVAEIFQKNGRLFMKNEYNGTEMFLNTKFGYPPKGWHHGGTLWGLTKDFKDFITTGEKSNHNNGYGGLYSPHWGYLEADMLAIQEKAKSLGYL